MKPMQPALEPLRIEGHSYHACRRNHLLFGFTEKGFPRRLLGRLLIQAKIRELKQIHSAFIHDIRSIAATTRGDGITLDQPGWAAVIKTADCVPLFFWTRRQRIAALLHIGWRGYRDQIEKRLLRILQEKNVHPGDMFFYMGPAIEGACYPVGKDVYTELKDRPFSETVFIPGSGDSWRFDLRNAIQLSLTAHGVPETHIARSPVCTFCDQHRFPSYRRDGARDQRIFNFILLTDHD